MQIIGVIGSYYVECFLVIIICHNYMKRYPVRVAKHKNAWIWIIGRIVFNNLTIKEHIHDLMPGNAPFHHAFQGVAIPFNRTFLDY